MQRERLSHAVNEIKDRDNVWTGERAGRQRGKKELRTRPIDSRGRQRHTEAEIETERQGQIQRQKEKELERNRERESDSEISPKS